MRVLDYEDCWTWRGLKQYVRHTNRHFLENRYNEFLSIIVEIAKKRNVVYKKGEPFIRARKGSKQEKSLDSRLDENIKNLLGSFLPYDKTEMWAPPLELNVNGRVNPCGISCLYVATDRETAIAEVKPYIGEKISVATFRSNNDVKLVDFTTGRADWMVVYQWNDIPVSSNDAEEIIWGQINCDFSVPVLPQEPEYSYVATQLVAELLKSEGFDGIVYRSGLTHTKGFNVALFDSKLVFCDSVELFELKKVTFEAEPYKSQLEKAIEGVN